MDLTGHRDKNIREARLAKVPGIRISLHVKKPTLLDYGISWLIEREANTAIWTINTALLIQLKLSESRCHYQDCAGAMDIQVRMSRYLDKDGFSFPKRTKG